MDELQSSGASATAADQVEIFDNGVHLGFADVTNGQWSLPDASLPVGVHALTAKYKGVTMTVPWRVTVENVEHFDDFESAPLGDFLSIVRPHYCGVVSPVGRYGNLGNGNISERDPGPGTGKYFFMSSYRDEFTYDFKQVYTMTFNELYAAVSFEFLAFTLQSGTASAKVEAFTESYARIALHTFPTSGRLEGVARLAGSNGQLIKSIVFTSAPSLGLVTHVIRVDNIRMVR